MWKLNRRDSSPIPLDVSGITPDRVAKLSAAEVAAIPVLFGNRRDPLGEFFDVSTSSLADVHFAGDTSCVHNIGYRMTGGFVFVENNAGRHAGAQMTGGKLILDMSAGDWLGAEITGGEIEVRGNVGHQCGAAYRGSRRGMKGGLIHIRGDAGDELGLLMRRGIIAVDGVAGEFAAASMIAGTILVLGGTERHAGAGMKRGTLIVGGLPPAESPSFAHACRYEPAFLTVLARSLLAHDVHIPLGPVECSRGDRATGGRGERWHLTVAAG